jgi:hypothetical protein
MHLLLCSQILNTGLYFETNGSIQLPPTTNPLVRSYFLSSHDRLVLIVGLFFQGFVTKVLCGYISFLIYLQLSASLVIFDFITVMLYGD